MGIKVILLIITFVILGPNNLILAQDNPEQVIELEKQVANNTSAAFVECAAYFDIATEAVIRTGNGMWAGLAIYRPKSHSNSGFNLNR